jgi:hypothetical protein
MANLRRSYQDSHFWDWRTGIAVSKPLTPDLTLWPRPFSFLVIQAWSWLLEAPPGMVA